MKNCAKNDASNWQFVQILCNDKAVHKKNCIKILQIKFFIYTQLLKFSSSSHFKNFVRPFLSEKKWFDNFWVKVRAKNMLRYGTTNHVRDALHCWCIMSALLHWNKHQGFVQYQTEPKSLSWSITALHFQSLSWDTSHCVVNVELPPNALPRWSTILLSLHCCRSVATISVSTNSNASQSPPTVKTPPTLVFNINVRKLLKDQKINIFIQR